MSKSSEGEEDLGQNVESQEILSQQAHDAEVRMISLVFDSSGLTPPMLTPLGEYFYNFRATLKSCPKTDEATLPSSPVAPVSPPAGDAAGDNAGTTAIGQLEEGEIPIVAS